MEVLYNKIIKMNNLRLGIRVRVFHKIGFKAREDTFKV
jgi:hypothetical protein